MTNVIYKNLDKSDAFTESVIDRITVLKSKFPEIEARSIRVTVNMDNSPFRPGNPLFSVKFVINNGRYKGLTLKKSASCLYTALSIASKKLSGRIKKVRSRIRDKKREGRRASRYINENFSLVAIE